MLSPGLGSSLPGPRATYQAGTALSITPSCPQLPLLFWHSPLPLCSPPLPLAASRAIGREGLRTVRTRGSGPAPAPRGSVRIPWCSPSAAGVPPEWRGRTCACVCVPACPTCSVLASILKLVLYREMWRDGRAEWVERSHPTPSAGVWGGSKRASKGLAPAPPPHGLSTKGLSMN